MEENIAKVHRVMMEGLFTLMDRMYSIIKGIRYIFYRFLYAIKLMISTR